MPSFNQFIRDWEKAEKAFIPEFVEAERATIDKADEYALKDSSGDYSQQELDDRNNPYGYGSRTPSGRKRGAVPYGDLGIVNEQTSAFKAAWTKVTASWSIDTISSALLNFSPAATFLKWGTNRMKPRPIDEKVIQQTTPFRMKQLERAANKIFGKFR